MGEINQARRHLGRTPHPNTPYTSSGSYGGWRACAICRDKRGGTALYLMPHEAHTWHEQIYTEMWNDYFVDYYKQEQT